MPILHLVLKNNKLRVSLFLHIVVHMMCVRDRHTGSPLLSIISEVVDPSFVSMSVYSPTFMWARKLYKLSVGFITYVEEGEISP